MNKKIILSAAAAATIALTITGCGSDNSSSGKTTGTTGSVTLSNGTVYTPSKGLLHNASLSEKADGTMVITGGTNQSWLEDDNVTHPKNDATIKSHTELTDGATLGGNYFTTISVNAVDAGSESNITTYLGELATSLAGLIPGTTIADLKVAFQGTTSDRSLENISTILYFMFKADTSAETRLNSLVKSNPNNFGTAVSSLATEMIASGKSPFSAATMTAMLQNLDTPSTGFYKVLKDLGSEDNLTSAEFAAAVNAASPLLSGLILDDNNDSDTTFTIDDSNLTTAQDSIYTDASGLVTAMIYYGSADTTGLNTNGSYALKINNLMAVSGTTGYLTSFTSNSNTSAVLYANSNKSVAVSLDLNSSTVTSLLSNAFTVNANATTVSLPISSLANLVGTDYDEAGTTNEGNGNFTAWTTGASSIDSMFTVDVNGIDMVSQSRKDRVAKEAIKYGSTDTFSGYVIIDGSL